MFDTTELLFETLICSIAGISTKIVIHVPLRIKK